MPRFRGVIAVSLTIAVVGLAPQTVQAAPSASFSTLLPSAAVSATQVSGWPSALRTSFPGRQVAVAVRLASRGGVAGRPVVVQRYRPSSRTWITVLRARTAATGRIALRWTAPTTPGSFRYRLSVASTARAAAVTTPPTTLRVIPVPATISVQLVRAVNLARSHARTCGTKAYPAVTPLVANSTLTRVANSYARRMGVESFFAHTSPRGDGPGERITAAGYRWSTYGEDIAAGYPSVASVMTGWLASPGHCAIIMGAGYAEIGAGHAVVAGSPYGRYWVLDLARR